MSRWIRQSAKAAIAVCLAFFTVVGWNYSRLPDTFYVKTGQTLQLSQMPWLTQQRQAGAQPAQAQSAGTSCNVTLSLFGTIPLKTVRMVSVQPQIVTVCGTPFGVKMFSNGALVVGFSDVSTAAGYCNPAKEAGVEIGDLISSINGRRVVTNEEVSAAIRSAGGQRVTVAFVREGKKGTLELNPACDENGNYRAGMWVRDSSAGIGTLTFCCDNNMFAGLGHAISDADTGTDISLLSGEIQAVNITGFERGTVGTPGELKGEFADGDSILGKVLANQTVGIYGTLKEQLSGRKCKVAQAQEVTTGDAQILTTIQGKEPQLYRVKIEHISFTAGDPNRNLVVHVVDEGLLKSTGGIVQGMSGSPILQNGQLVGAVTHVLVNDPTRGYGVFAETMLTETEKIAEQQAG